MNQTLEQLAQQAAAYAIEFAVKDQALYMPKFTEKLAELIIKECAKICFREAEGHNMAFGEHCGIVIKEHFGVK